MLAPPLELLLALEEPDEEECWLWPASGCVLLRDDDDDDNDSMAAVSVATAPAGPLPLPLCAWPACF